MRCFVDQASGTARDAHMVLNIVAMRRAGEGLVHGRSGWIAVVPQRLILSGMTVVLLMVADDVGNMVWRVTAANSELAIVASAR